MELVPKQDVKSKNSPKKEKNEKKPCTVQYDILYSNVLSVQYNTPPNEAST